MSEDAAIAMGRPKTSLVLSEAEEEHAGFQQHEVNGVTRVIDTLLSDSSVMLNEIVSLIIIILNR